MAGLLTLTDIQQFAQAGTIPRDAVTEEILQNVSKLNEKQQIEPWLRDILKSVDETPHGPTEIADILTTRVTVRGQPKFAAFVNKGKSLPRVSSRHVAHQFMKLEQLPDLGVAVFLAVGDIQDDAQRDFVQIANDIGCDWLIIDKTDAARLFIAYHMICHKDGLPFTAGRCAMGHEQTAEIKLEYRVRERAEREILHIRDLSHIGAKRLSAVLLVDRHYPQPVLRQIIKEAVHTVRRNPYVRDKLVRAVWGTSPAHVVWLNVGHDMSDVCNSNWVCQACWIDPNLPRGFRPLWDATQDVVDGVMIVWNPEYQTIKKSLGSATGSKSDVIDHIEAVLGRALSILAPVKQRFATVRAGRCDEESLEALMRSYAAAVDELDRKVRDAPVPPPDCRDYAHCFRRIMCDFQDLWLYYTEESFLHRPRENRQGLFEESLRRIEDALQKLEYERQKLQGRW